MKSKGIRAWSRKGERYTPITPEFLDWMEAVKEHYGGSWATVVRAMDYHHSGWRRFRNGYTRTASIWFVDRVITASGVGNLDDFPWFTKGDLVTLGIWDGWTPRRNKVVAAQKAERKKRKEYLEKRWGA